MYKNFASNFLVILLSSKLYAQESLKFEGIGEVFLPMGKEIKASQKLGFNISGKIAYMLDEKLGFTGSIGFNYFVPNKSETSMNINITEALFKLGMRYYVGKNFFVEPQVGYAIGYSTVLSVTQDLGGGIVIAPTIGYRVGGILFHTKYEYCSVKNNEVKNNLSNFGIGMAIRF
ncbi:MAG: hypothetical protein NTZ59_00110 [Bacteroidetes bacterium]|nr:hypothetical protein [Bacteroidota bacterium]